jgi:hypothetical protein
MARVLGRERAWPDADRQRVGIGAAPRLQPGLHRQARSRWRDPEAGGGFALDPSRVAYLRYLRRERQQSPRAVADAEHATALLRLRIAEKQRELVPRVDFDAVIDGIAGVVLTHLSGMAARCSNDLMVRRKIDVVVYEVRKEMAKVALEMADKNGEPPLGEQS